MNDEYFMKFAIKEAKKALKKGDWAVGCVVVLNNEIISKAHNRGYSTENRLAHAELRALDKAINKIGRDISSVVVYTTYEPCPMCFGAILINRIKKVVTGIDIDESGSLKLANHLPKKWSTDEFKIKHVENVLYDECLKVFLQGKPTKKLIKKRFQL